MLKRGTMRESKSQRLPALLLLIAIYLLTVPSLHSQPPAASKPALPETSQTEKYTIGFVMESELFYDQALNLLSDPKYLEQIDEIYRLLKDSAMRGHAQAQNYLGALYGQGIGLPVPEPEQAVDWYRLAADQGDTVGEYNLGWCYHFGQGLKVDYGAAHYWYQKAIEEDHPEAANNLGVLYSSGLGVQQDLSEAARWFQEGARLGSPSAQFNLASALERGAGIPRDQEAAFEWYSRAAEGGHPGAPERMQDLQRSGSSNEP